MHIQLKEEGQPKLPEWVASQEGALTMKQEKQGQCSSCKARVIWAQLEPNMTWAPIDVEPVPNGNIGLRKVAGQIIGHYIKKDEQYDYPRRTNHFATCPYAKQHKKGGR